MTPFELSLQSELEIEWQRFANDWLFQWHGMTYEGGKTDVDDFRGGRIRYSGISFGGQQQLIFWQAIGRYLAQKIHSAFKEWDAATRRYPLPSRRESIDGVESLLRSFANQIVMRASDTDRRLRGRGYPERVQPFNSTDYQSSAVAEISRLGAAHRALVHQASKDGKPEAVEAPPISTVAVRRAFISYSHDFTGHKDWVRGLAGFLRENGIEVVLDQWDLELGDDLPSFMERAIRDTDRVLVICTDNYNAKANAGAGGVGYEKTILTAEMLQDPSKRRKFIPIVRDVTGGEKLPTFFGAKYYLDLSGGNDTLSQREQLLRNLHEVAVTKPPLGASPFLSKEPPNRNFTHRILA